VDVGCFRAPHHIKKKKNNHVGENRERGRRRMGVGGKEQKRQKESAMTMQEKVEGKKNMDKPHESQEKNP